MRTIKMASFLPRLGGGVAVCGDGGVMGRSRSLAYDPSVREDADTSPETGEERMS